MSVDILLNLLIDAIVPDLLCGILGAASLRRTIHSAVLFVRLPPRMRANLSVGFEPGELFGRVLSLRRALYKPAYLLRRQELDSRIFLQKGLHFPDVQVVFVQVFFPLFVRLVS